jgi:hypothetical protein
MSSLALNRPIKEANPVDIPVDQTNYWGWLEFTQQQDIHNINTKLEYLTNCFKFKKGVHTLTHENRNTLKLIEQQYFDRVLLPKVKERIAQEQTANN